MSKNILHAIMLSHTFTLEDFKAPYPHEFHINAVAVVCSNLQTRADNRPQLYTLSNCASRCSYERILGDYVTDKNH